MDRFFIIGSPRSGTTLFRLMLNKHPEITVPPEAGFLTWLHKKYHNYYNSVPLMEDFIDELFKTKKIENWNIDKFSLLEYIKRCEPVDYCSLIDSVYRFYSEKILNKLPRLYGDKNNFFLNNISLINDLYPKSKFIHIIRDGRSVAVSYKNLNKKSCLSANYPNLPNSIEDIANSWKSDIDVVNRDFDTINDISRCKTIRFEDLVTQPKEVLVNVCDFLNVDYDDKMLEYYNTTEKEGLEPKEFDAWKSKNKKPLILEEVNKWEYLSVSEREKFENICLENLKCFGYL